MSLSDVANQTQYVETCWTLSDSWRGFSPPERMNRLLNAVNTIFRSIQIPAFTASMGKGLGGANAQLDFQTWSVQMDPGVMSNAAADRSTIGALAVTMYHEARHGEQWYRVAQAVAAGICVPAGVVAANARYGVTAQQIATALWIPQHIAQDAEQKKRFFPAAMQALVTSWFSSIYGANAAHRMNTLNALSANNNRATFTAYRHLPEEVDAHENEQAIRALWKTRMRNEDEEEAMRGVSRLFG
jgi:hypothetical protein